MELCRAVLGLRRGWQQEFQHNEHTLGAFCQTGGDVAQVRRFPDCELVRRCLSHEHEPDCRAEAQQGIHGCLPEVSRGHPVPLQIYTRWLLLQQRERLLGTIHLRIDQELRRALRQLRMERCAEQVLWREPRQKVPWQRGHRNGDGADLRERRRCVGRS